MHNTNASVRPKATEAKSDSLATRLQTAVELLEEIVADRTVLADIPEPERNRLLNAAGRVSRPDALDRG